MNIFLTFRLQGLSKDSLVSAGGMNQSKSGNLLSSDQSVSVLLLYFYTRQSSLRTILTGFILVTRHKCMCSYDLSVSLVCIPLLEIILSYVVNLFRCR